MAWKVTSLKKVLAQLRSWPVAIRSTDDVDAFAKKVKGCGTSTREKMIEVCAGVWRRASARRVARKGDISSCVFVASR